MLALHSSAFRCCVSCGTSVLDVLNHLEKSKGDMNYSRLSMTFPAPVFPGQMMMRSLSCCVLLSLCPRLGDERNNGGFQWIS